MSRVRAVVGRSIKVNLRDVVIGDVLYSLGNESDLIVSDIEWNGDLVRLWYKPNKMRIPHTIWMTPEVDKYGDGGIFIHDLNHEIEEYFLELGDQDDEDIQDRVSG